jgi:hypothetical protein
LPGLAAQRVDRFGPARETRSGKPVIVLVDCGGTPHWVAVSGYKKDAAGQVWIGSSIFRAQKIAPSHFSVKGNFFDDLEDETFVTRS